MITISLCMIVKNEENTIEKCLNSIKDVVDEIVIVDTGSTDCTKEIILKYTNKVYDFEWINDFSVARNFSFEQATMDYIMWLDADDIIMPEDLTKLKDLKTSMSDEVDVVMMTYNTGFDKNGRVTFSCFRERLVKRSRNFKWKEPVHECLELGGKVLNSDICVTHSKQHYESNTRNINIYDELLGNNKALSPRGMYYYARELKEHGRFNEAIQWFNTFLDSNKGWVEDNISACGDLARCYLSINKHNEALTSMMRSFSFDTPRAEVCCQLGYYFKELGKYKSAAFWFESALNLEEPKNNWGFYQHDFWGYIPSIECAVCYDCLGNYEKASAYNDKAAEYKPNSPSVIYNKIYFKNRIGEQ